VQDVNDDSRDAITRQARNALGSRLREIRESRGMTQTAVARQAGHGRYPVIETDIDHMAGILHVRDVFHLGQEPRTPEELRAILRPAAS